MGLEIVGPADLTRKQREAARPALADIRAASEALYRASRALQGVEGLMGVSGALQQLGG